MVTLDMKQAPKLNQLQTPKNLSNLTKKHTNAGFGHFTGIKNSRNSLIFRILQKRSVEVRLEMILR